MNKYVNSLKLVAGFTFISFSLRLARNSILTNTNTPVKASNLQRYPSGVLLKAKMDLSHRKWTKERLSGTDISEYQSVLGAYRISGNGPLPLPLPSRCFDFIFTLVRISQKLDTDVPNQGQNMSQYRHHFLVKFLPWLFTFKGSVMTLFKWIMFCCIAMINPLKLIISLLWSLYSLYF